MIQLNTQDSHNIQQALLTGVLVADIFIFISTS